MDKRQKMKDAKEFQKMYLIYTDQRTRKGQIALKYAESQGYHYLRIRVEDMNSGEEVLGPFYTFRKWDEQGKLCEDLERIAAWPRELLGALRIRMSVSGEVWFDGNTTELQVYDKQWGGGRPKQDSVSKKKSEEYASIYRSFMKSGLSQRQFCAEYGIARSKLQRAITHQTKTNHKKKIQKIA